MLVKSCLYSRVIVFIILLLCSIRIMPTLPWVLWGEVEGGLKAPLPHPWAGAELVGGALSEGLSLKAPL